MSSSRSLRVRLFGNVATEWRELQPRFLSETIMFGAEHFGVDPEEWPLGIGQTIAVDVDHNLSRLEVPEYPPPKQVIEYVAWKLGVAMDGFYGRMLLLVPHADLGNRALLRQAFPGIVEAWEAWMVTPDGDFELPPSSAALVGKIRTNV